MKIKNTLCGLIAAAALTSSASAVQYYVDVDSYGLLGTTIDSGNTVSSSFNIVDNGGDSLFDIFSPDLSDTFGDGYDPATQEITGAWAFFTISDDNIFGDNPLFGDPTETFSIELSDALFSAGEAGIFEVIFDGVGVSAIIDLDEDGIVNYTVSSLNGGDFQLFNAGLKATYQDRSVPDSGFTISLLGFSLFGMFIAQKKRK